MHIMPLAIRHCVECPKCHIRYLIGFSPYRNGSYLVRTGEGSCEEYTLYCFCQGTRTTSRWCAAKACAVSKPSHGRGYGTPDEIWTMGDKCDHAAKEGCPNDNRRLWLAKKY